MSFDPNLHYKAVARFGQEICPHRAEQGFLKAWCTQCMADARSIVEQEQRVIEQDERIAHLEAEMAQLRDEGGGPGSGNE